MELYTAQSRGRLHIAADQNYVGSINQYKNCFTRFFTMLFGTSMKLSVHGRVYRVNKKSYRNLLDNTGNSVEGKIKHYGHLESVLINIPQNNSPMRYHIRQKQNFYQKMVRAMVNGDEDLAKKMIGKGAELNSTFWVRTNGQGISFTGLRGCLPIRSLKLEGRSYTPLLWAAEKGQTKVINFLGTFGVDKAQGERTKFERKIDRVNTEEKLEVRNRLVENYHQPYYYPDAVYPSGYHYETELYTRTVVHTHYTDETTKLETMSYDANNGFQKQQVQNPKTEVTRHVSSTP